MARYLESNKATTRHRREQSRKLKDQLTAVQARLDRLVHLSICLFCSVPVSVCLSGWSIVCLSVLLCVCFCLSLRLVHLSVCFVLCVCFCLSLRLVHCLFVFCSVSVCVFLSRTHTHSHPHVLTHTCT